MQTAAPQQYPSPIVSIPLEKAVRSALASALERAGIRVSRYGLVAILVLIGGLKFGYH